NSCIFRGVSIGSGSIGFTSSAVNNPPYGGPDFQVASLAFCATHPGTAVLHWQFYRPDPLDRNTALTNSNGQELQNRLCYQDYVINIVGPTVTPSPTFTPAPPTISPTPSRTRTVPRTRTATVTATGTPPTQ